MEANMLSIGQVSKIAGVHIKSLRYYDRIGVLRPAYTNPETGYRYYTVPQLYTLEAIQMCIELDIPLKEFSRFVDDDHRLHNGELIAYGSEILRKHMASIQKSMEIIKLLQREMEIIEQFADETGIYEREFGEITVALIPVTGGEEDVRFFQSIGDAYVALQASGLTLDYAYGYLYDFFPDRTERYSFIQIANAPQATDVNLRVLPAGMRPCKWAREKSIERAQAIFPASFDKGGVVTVVESEMMSRDQDIHETLLELSVVAESS